AAVPRTPVVGARRPGLPSAHVRQRRWLRHARNGPMGRRRTGQHVRGEGQGPHDRLSRFLRGYHSQFLHAGLGRSLGRKDGLAGDDEILAARRRAIAWRYRMPITNANGKICYLEIPAADVQKSADFYRAVFGWEIRKRGDGATAFHDGVEVSGAFVTGR